MSNRPSKAPFQGLQARGPEHSVGGETTYKQRKDFRFWLKSHGKG